MKKIVVGILAHVDAGKTTLSEGLLYSAGEIRNLGRVDKQNTFLDTDELERKRGITIFSKQAVMNIGNTYVSLIDTPGHIDFSAEAERTLGVLDYAILVISASDGIQSHTKTLWELLKKHSIPTFIFINKLDLPDTDITEIIEEMKKDLGANFVDFTDKNTESFNENIALCDEDIMHSFLESGNIDNDLIVNSIRKCNIYPCFGGSALKMNGVQEFLNAIDKYTSSSSPVNEFGAKVYKITEDDKGSRLSFIKVTGGSLKVKSLIETGDGTFEKINEIRIYSGDKYKNVDTADFGSVCAVCGPGLTYAGQGLGYQKNSDKLTLEPIFSYRVVLPQGIDSATALAKLKKLEQEETMLNVSWNEQLKEIQIRIMGEIQLEVLKDIIKKRFDFDVDFEEGHILYKETIANIAEGVGHYEPLRHYAEVHLLLEPLERGAGMHFTSDCSEEVLDKNWQRLVLTHLMEKNHIGVLTGSPLTDIKITLKSGKAHLKHTDGGDFRQATYRAVRHGVRMAKSILLEPYYSFELSVPSENVGRAMTDLDVMGAKFTMPQIRGDMTLIAGRVCAEGIRNYHKDIIGYTHGKGKLSCKFDGYDICTNPEKVIEEIGYNPDSDIENTADSVFCAHGAGFNVKWDEVTSHMHLESVLKQRKQISQKENAARSHSISASDEELIKIFENTYGKIQVKNPNHTMHTQKAQPVFQKNVKQVKNQKEYLLVDGYNIIFSWDSLKSIARDSLEAARNKLIERIATYKVFKKYEIIVVFDAYKVKGNKGEIEKTDGITIVYTKEAQTADAYIEKTAKELSYNYRVTVATSDGLEQLIIFGSGAYRMPSRILEKEVEDVEQNIREMLNSYNIDPENTEFLRVLRNKFGEYFT